jgi:hypothetical protein
MGFSPVSDKHIEIFQSSRRKNFPLLFSRGVIAILADYPIAYWYPHRVKGCSRYVNEVLLSDEGTTVGLKSRVAHRMAQKLHCSEFALISDLIRNILPHWRVTSHPSFEDQPPPQVYTSHWDLSSLDFILHMF